jgi:predicted phage terminase large subunit-like protein
MTAQADTALKPFPGNRFILFIIQYLSRHLIVDCAPLHIELCNIAHALLQAPAWLAIDIARHFAKTTFMSRMFPLHSALDYPYSKIQLVGSGGGPNSVVAENIKWIREELESNVVLANDYKYEKGKAWGSEHIDIVRPNKTICSIYARGKGSDIRGQRGMIILDDVQNQEDVESEAILATDEKWLLSDTIPVLSHDDPLVFIGSGLSPLSLLSKCKSSGLFKVFEFPALVDAKGQPSVTGESVWPEKHPTEFLQKLRRAMGDDLFNANFMCHPLVSGNPVFRREWFASYDPTSAHFEAVKGRGLHIITAVDGAYSLKKSSDYTAIVTIGVTREPEPTFYVLNVFRDRTTLPSAAEWLYSIASQYNSNLVFIESDKVNPPEKNDPLVMEFERVMTQHGRRFVLDWEHPRQDKVARAFEIQGLVQNRRVFFNQADQEQLALMNEMEMFTGDQKFHDDMVDALVHAITKGLGMMPDTSDGKPIIVRSTKGAQRADAGVQRW